MSLEELRNKIDSIDIQLLKLFNERMEVVKQVGELKHKSGGSIYRPEREKEIISKMNSLNDGLLTPSAIEALYLEIFAISRNLELPEKISYLGPEGSFTHQAAESRFGGMSDYIPLNSIKSVFKAVETKKVKYGVVPVENSSNGMVIDTLNSFYTTTVKIVSEIIMPIHHDLATKADKIKDIKKIYSKDIAFAQCSLFLESFGLEDDVEVIPVESTAKAAKLASMDKNAAAICSRVAAKIYNLPILFENIEDKDDNFTRFVIISDFENEPSKESKTSIIVTIPDKPGSLVKFLQQFHDKEINLTKIESHTVGSKALFFIDFDGHKDEPQIKEIFEKNQEYIKILGSYVKESV